MVPELSMTMAMHGLEVDEGPPELLSPEVSPRVGVPEEVDVHDPVLNVRIKMRSKELEMTEGLANYAVKRKAILCNDNHPMGAQAQGRNGCTLRHVCNQIHVKPGILQHYRDAAIKNGAEPKGFIKVVHAVDPTTKTKAGVKFGHTEDTMGRDKYRRLAVTTPSPAEEDVDLEFCSAYLSAKGCQRKRKCPNIHVKHDEWRKQGCCNEHLVIPAGVEWGRELLVNNGTVSKNRVIVTKGLRMLGKADPSPGPIAVPSSSLCKYHLDGYCKMNVNCDSVHICRSLDLTTLTPPRKPLPTPGPFPLLFAPTGSILPLECIEPTTGLSAYQGIPTPCQVSICPNHLTSKGCQNSVECHLIHVNPLWYSAQVAATGWMPMQQVIGMPQFPIQR